VFFYYQYCYSCMDWMDILHGFLLLLWMMYETSPTFYMKRIVHAKGEQTDKLCPKSCHVAKANVFATQ
jgi:hypothetical protein